jgi:hypothetical protein
MFSNPNFREARDGVVRLDEEPELVGIGREHLPHTPSNDLYQLRSKPCSHGCRVIRKRIFRNSDILAKRIFGKPDLW